MVATEKAMQNIQSEERNSAYAKWHKEAEDFNRMLEQLGIWIEGQTSAELSNVQLEMRNRILSELFELHSSLHFARMEALKQAARYKKD